MARKTKEETERTYHALLDAAATLFIRHGVANTTLNDIAQAARMTRGAIYWHFDNKDAVIKSLWERNAGNIHQQICRQIAALESAHPDKLFRDTVLSILNSVVEDPQVGQAIQIVMHSIELTEEKTELQQFLNDKHQEFYTAFETAFRKLGQLGLLKSELPPELLAQSILSYLYGLIHKHLEPSGRKLDLENHGEQLLNLLLDPILA